MPDEPDPIDQLLDAALYVPLGLALELRERFPELAERGRQHLTTQVAVARMIGKFAVQMGTKQVGAFLQRQRDGAAERVGGAADEPSAAPPGAPAAAPSDGAPAGRPPAPAARGPVPSDPGGDPRSLPIAGYDTLAASQVVARLDGLDAAALEAVRAYEAAHRNRKTILGKVAQLLRSA